MDSQSRELCGTSVGFDLKRSPGIYVTIIVSEKLWEYLFLLSCLLLSALTCIFTLSAVVPHTTAAQYSMQVLWFLGLNAH